MDNSINPKVIKPAPYNPREITELEYNGLKYSMEKFNDISGIVYNKKTGNLIGGHHRWRKLSEDSEALSIDHVIGEFYAIKDAGSFTGYLMRVVEWDKSVEKGANVTANSHTVSGKFNVDILASLMEEIKIETPEIYEKTNAEALELDLKINFDASWDNNGSADGDSNLDGIEALIKVKYRNEDKKAIVTFLEEKLLTLDIEGVKVE